VAAPAGVPAPVLATISQQLERLAKDPEVQAAMLRQGVVPGWLDARAAAAFMAADTARWKKVADFAGIRLD